MSRTVTMSSHDALFKDLYSTKGVVSLVNKKTPLASILLKNKNVDFVGKKFVQPLRFGSAVGLGFRGVGQNLPTPKGAPMEDAYFAAKRAYATAEYDREAIVASRNDKGAFAKVTVNNTEATVEGFNLHMLERALFGDGSGKLGQIDDSSITGAGTVASPWEFTLDTTGTNAPKGKAKWYPRGAAMDLYTTGGVYQMTIEIVSAVSSSGTITIKATTKATGAVTKPQDDDILYWEGNKGQEIVGLESFVTTGTLYGIDQSANPEFVGTVKSITGSLSYEDLNNAVAELEDLVIGPNLGICSSNTLALIKNLSEDAKRYSAGEVKSSDLTIGFKGVELLTDSGACPVVSSQMCPDGEIWLMNKDYMQIVMRQDFGWFDDDGTILMRDPNKDVYAARFGGYFELFNSMPNSVMKIKGFSM